MSRRRSPRATRPVTLALALSLPLALPGDRSGALLHAQTAATAAKSAPVNALSAFDSTSFTSLSWRNVGPWRGGRSVAAAGLPSNPMTYFAGYTGGGVWRTDDAGLSWRNISDGFYAKWWRINFSVLFALHSQFDCDGAERRERDLRGHR